MYQCWVPRAKKLVKLHNVKRYIKMYSCTCPYHEGIQREQRYSSTHSQPQQQMEVSGHLQPWLLYSWGNNLATHGPGDWVGPKASLDILEKGKFFHLHRAKPHIVHPLAQSLLQLCLPTPYVYTVSAMYEAV
jgi:hypothetical protein